MVVASAGAQTTTGRILGTVSDLDGRPLPGVTVTIASPVSIGGPQTKVVDENGSFQFIGLHPGGYTLKADLPGFVSQERLRVKVPLGGAAVLSIEMPQSTFESEIEVVAETPIVDPTQSNTEQIFDSRYLQLATVGSVNRAYQGVLRQAAGVAGGDNPNVFGSTLSDNAFFIDGQDTTDPVTATWGSIFNFDSIAEIELQTSGFEAQYGRAIGGLVNVVTRSGGNRFSGTFDLRLRSSSFQESGDRYDADTLDSSFYDVAATLGGPLVRDRLWFFVASELVNSEETPAASPTTRSFEGINYNAKITWQATSSWRLFARFAGSPAEIDNDNASQFVRAEAGSFQSQGTDLYAVEVYALLSDSLVWKTVVGAFRSTLDVYPMSGDLETPSHFDFSTGALGENYDNQQYTERDRDDVTTDLTWFTDLAGAHELKLGLQYSGTGLRSTNCSTGTSGGACEPGSIGYAYWDLGPGQPYFLLERTTAGAQDFEGTLWTSYLQDDWRAVTNLSLKVGVRYDSVSYDNNIGTRVADMSRVQPRLGAAWDISGDAKNVLRGSWGRFLSPSSLTLPGVLRARNEPHARWSSCSTLGRDLGVTSREECAELAGAFGWEHRDDDPDDFDPWGWLLPPSGVTGVGGTRVQADLKSSYADTLSLSYEREIGRRASVELSYVDKATRSLFEDTCEGNIPEPSEGSPCGSYALGNLPGLRRDYRAAMLKLETRTFNWLSLLASYTYSKSEGNLGFSQGNLYDFDYYPYNWVNRQGYLADHRLHRFKLNGFGSLKGDWVVAFDGFWSSAFRWQPQADPGDDGSIPGGFVFLEPRGSRKAFDAYNLDLQLSKGFTLGGGMRVVLIGSVLNTFSSEYGTQVCSDIGGCGDFEMGEAIEWARPRRYELGFRMEF